MSMKRAKTKRTETIKVSHYEDVRKQTWNCLKLFEIVCNTEIINSRVTDIQKNNKRIKIHKSMKVASGKKCKANEHTENRKNSLKLFSAWVNFARHISWMEEKYTFYAAA